MEELQISLENKKRLEVLMQRNGFRDYDEALNFLLEFYETYTRRKLLLRELEEGVV
ncbi:hypothetical protein [Pyrococcus kukulkanii]|uniref:hypothetical protein n=1 Tax=Pyrococcus kukulkanii TaxID=1609559 RepID=UPI003568D0B5